MYIYYRSAAKGPVEKSFLLRAAAVDEHRAVSRRTVRVRVDLVDFDANRFRNEALVDADDPRGRNLFIRRHLPVLEALSKVQYGSGSVGGCCVVIRVLQGALRLAKDLPTIHEPVPVLLVRRRRPGAQHGRELRPLILGRDACDAVPARFDGTATAHAPRNGRALQCERSP